MFKEYLETQHSCRPVINTAGGSVFFVRKLSGSSTKPNILCFEPQLGSAYFVLNHYSHTILEKLLIDDDENVQRQDD